VVPYLLIRAALPHLREARGSVINIGSVNAWSGEPNLMPYSVSKGALMTLTRNLGDMLETEAGIDYSFGNRAFNTYAAYLNSVKESDLYRGDGTRNEGALTAPSTVAHKIDVGIGYSTIPLYRQKRFAVPMQIKASYNSTLGGRNTAIASFTRVDLIAFF
jgi:NAD(P)-dependent dehydrogenase (short-subunit alcohol dehydrogenase family)